MKKLILGLVLMGLSQTALAKECRFPYDLAEEEGVQVLRTFEIESAEYLTDLQLLQVLEVANRWATVSDYDGYEDIDHAVHVLRADGGDLNYKVFKFEGVVYTEVVLYPGDNAYGVIFKGAKVVAEQQDGDIVCQ